MAAVVLVICLIGMVVFGFLAWDFRYDPVDRGYLFAGLFYLCLFLALIVAPVVF